MALFILSYDLRKSREYQTLYDELEKFNAVRILESLWCFDRINTNTEGLKNHFKQFIDKDDGLFVSQVAVIDGRNQWSTFNTDGTPKA